MEQVTKTNDINTLTAEILILKQQTAQNIIEIGKRLIAVKESLPHGEWGNYLKDKVDFTERTAQKFIKVSQEFGKTNTYSDLPISKLYALLDVPLEERETFIKENPVDEMTTRELQKTIKEKKELENTNKHLEQSFNELSNRYSNLEEKLNQEKNKLPKTIEVDNTDYETINKLKKELNDLKNDKQYYENKVENLQNQLNLYKKDSDEYKNLKSQIENLTKEKDDISRMIESATSLSGYIFKIEKFLQTELAPIQYSRAILDVKENPTVINNLKEIIECVEKWCMETRRYLPKEQQNIINVEVL